jgi:hypothetical protein
MKADRCAKSGAFLKAMLRSEPGLREPVEIVVSVVIVAVDIL